MQHERDDDREVRRVAVLCDEICIGAARDARTPNAWKSIRVWRWAPAQARFGTTVLDDDDVFEQAIFAGLLERGGRECFSLFSIKARKLPSAHHCIPAVLRLGVAVLVGKVADDRPAGARVAQRARVSMNGAGRGFAARCCCTISTAMSRR